MNKLTIQKKIILVLSIFMILFGAAFGIAIYRECNSFNFGSTHDSFPSKRQSKECCRGVNTEGLAKLNAYGSGFIYFPDFKEYFRGSSKKVYVVSLMTDEIYYYKDRCLRWYGLGYTEKNLGEPIFTRKIFKNAYKGLIRIVYGSPPIHDLSQLQTERQIIRELGEEYYMPLKGSDEWHYKQTYDDWLSNQDFIDNMLRLFESVPEDAHLYIHCAHGKGRTTTFLVFYDIFRNGKNVPLKDIVKRHYCLGREDVFDTEVWPQGSWSQVALVARKELVERFYDYMTDVQGYGHQSWAQWRETKGIMSAPVVIHRKDEIALAP